MGRKRTQIAIREINQLTWEHLEPQAKKLFLKLGKRIKDTSKVISIEEARTVR